MAKTRAKMVQKVSKKCPKSVQKRSKKGPKKVQKGSKGPKNVQRSKKRAKWVKNIANRAETNGCKTHSSEVQRQVRRVDAVEGGEEAQQAVGEPDCGIWVKEGMKKRDMGETGHENTGYDG